MKSILDIIREEISEFNRTVFTDVPQDIYIHLRQRKFSDDANKSHMKIFRSKDGRDFLVKKTINQDVFHVYDFSNLQNPIATAVFDVQNDYFSGYEHRQSIEVNPNYRRIGVATALTDFAENIYNLPYKPSGLQSTEMQGFTQSRFNGDTNDPDELQEGQWLGQSKVDNKFNENFWNWFGQSKVVDRSGQPLRVYHGTTADFQEFKSETGLMYFSRTPKYASAFATNPHIKNVTIDSAKSVMPVYLSIQKPLDLTEFKTDIVSRYEFGGKLDDLGIEINSDNLKDYPLNINIGEDVMAWQWIRFNSKYLLPIIKSKGYDGIFMYEQANTGSKDIQDVAYVVFEPTQIKSASGNDGNFDPSNPDITKESIEEQLIRELTSLVEGVADRYAEREFNIPDSTKQQDQQATQALPVDNSMGEHIGDVMEYGGDDDYQYHSGEPMNLEVESRVFANPRSLDKFGVRVRAVSDDRGNLFVAETDGRFFHDGLEHVVMNSKYGNAHTDYIQWYRQGNSIMFTLSSTYTQTINKPLDKEEEAKYIMALRQKNPQFRFLVPQQQQVAGQNVQEGVADKYAERAFNIPDNTKTPDAPGEKPFMTMTVEVPDWMITGGRTEHIPVYLNPRSLNGFQSDVRAISDTQGNLYVAQLDGHFIHSDMGEQLGLTPDDLHQSVYHQMNKFQLLHRVGDDNSFGLADSTTNYARQDSESKKAGIDLLRKVKVKNPQFEYYPEYYRNVEAYDSDPISADGNDIYAEDINNYDRDGDNIGDDNGLTTKDFQESIEEQIIRELQTLVEGVADKYAERAFNIPDPTKAADQRAIAGIKDLPDEPKDTSMGEFVGEFPVFDSGKYQQVPVYMNPRTLDKFEEDVKAVSNKTGDLFIAQLDLAFYHDDIINSVKGENIYPSPVYNAYDESENITWHRIGSTNEFGWSVSYKRFGYKPENRKYVAMMMQAVMKKNPGYRFIPQYWMETKQQRYDASHNVNTDSLLNY